jgi:hypothetical protein
MQLGPTGRVLAAASTLAVLAGFAIAAAASASTASHHTAAAGAAVRPAALGPGLGVPAPDVSPDDAGTCANAAAKAGFSFTHFVGTSAGSYREITIAVAVCLAESSGRSNVYLCNPGLQDGDYPPVSCPAGTTSVDRGLWQINSFYHSNISNECAFQAQCNANAAYGISDHGTDWEPWHTFTSGAWIQYLSDAETAMTQVTFTLTGDRADKCLEADPGQGHDGGGVELEDCDSSNTQQQWHVDVQGTGDILLANVGSGHCLDTIAGQGRDGGGVQQWWCDHTDQHQQWAIVGSGNTNSNGSANAMLENNGSRYCLATKAGDGVPGGVVYQWGCDIGNTYLLWN